MFILLGMRLRTTSVGTGRFLCPNDHRETSYVHLSARRWFTLFFIPVIPLGSAGEWVQCESCGAEYDVDVLSHPAPAAFGAQAADDTSWGADGSWGAEGSWPEDGSWPADTSYGNQAPLRDRAPWPTADPLGRRGGQ